MKMPVTSVRARLLLLSLGLVTVLGSANLLLGYLIGQNQQKQEEQREQYHRLAIIQACEAAIAESRHIHSQINTAVLMKSGTEQSQIDLENRFEMASREVRQQLNKLNEFDPQSASAISEAFEQYPQHSKRAIDFIASGNQAAAEPESKLLDADLNTIESNLKLADRKVRESGEAFLVKEASRIQSSIRWANFIIVTAGTIGVLLALVVVRSIIRPLHATTSAIREVNSGRTEIDLPPVGKDEFGVMAVALRQFRDQAEILRKRAYYDPLTGVGNRALFEDYLQKAIDRSRIEDSMIALFYIDLDNFRAVNDRWGHHGGDRYLCEAVARLHRFIPSDSLLCRYEGDNFGVLIEGLPIGEPWEGSLRDKAGIVLRGMSEPYLFEEQLLNMSVSIGIAVFPSDGESPQQLVSAADAAMYVAKRAGRNNFRFANAHATNHFRKQLALANDIRRGLENGEFEPFFQPIVDVEQGRVVGAEALVRWRHPQRGLLLPGEFIDVAEESGLINRLGDQCLRASHRQNLVWREAGRDLNIAVNLSVRQVQEGNILETLRSLKRDAEGRQNLVDFELTESALLDASEHGEDVLAEIKKLGYRLGLDDFGTGYASFSYLRRLPIDKIKIDRQFVVTMGNSKQALAIVSAILTLAKTLELDVVAEGIETLEQSQHLRALGSNFQQGFLFAKALPVLEFDLWAAAYEHKADLDKLTKSAQVVTT